MKLNPDSEAQKILNKLWNPNVFPVDPVTIAKKIGVRVLDTELPESVSGALIKEEGKEPVIALHRQDHHNCKRFACAHGLGHYIARIESDDVSGAYEYVYFRNAAASDGVDEDEVFANQFAASLLMPGKEVKDLVGGGATRLTMSLYFGVSPEALKHRLSNLDLLSK